ncbi:hypothetical protein MD484_g762, partial [Candolleomyces efflorescens]
MEKQPHPPERQVWQSDDSVANPPDDTSRPWRIAIDIGLLFGVIFMLIWPWVFFGIINAQDGIQMPSTLSDMVQQYPQRVAAVVTLIGTGTQVIATCLLSQIIVRFGQELVDRGTVTVFDVSALSAFRYMTFVWGLAQGKGLAKAKRRLAIVLLFLAALGASSLIPSGTAVLITPGAFNKTAELRATELDFTSDSPECTEWLERNRLNNLCDWARFGDTQFTTCLGENQMLDTLDSGRANVLASIGISDKTSSLNQLGGLEEGGIRFRGSVKGVLPIGPNGIPAFDTIQTTSNPFNDEDIRMVSYNYTLNHQGLESNVNCYYEDTSPIGYREIPYTNTTRFISSFGTCDSAAGLQNVLESVEEYVTLNGNNTLTYWACKQIDPPGPLDPTYFVYLRGRRNYKTSIGNITCRISPMRSQEYAVNYLSVPGYFTTSRAHDAQSGPRKPTFSRFIEWGLVGFGNIIWEGQNWSSNLVAETVFSLAEKRLNGTTREKNPITLNMFEAMVQGMLEYQATYSRLVYSIRPDRPSTCLRDVTGSVSYSVRGWHIKPQDFVAQAGLLLPMTLINLASLILLLSCFFIGKSRYRYSIDVTDKVSLLTAFVPQQDKEGRVRWGDGVEFSQASKGFRPVPNEVA